MSPLIRLICILPHGMAPVWFDLHNFMHEIMLLNFNTFPVNSLAYFDVVGLGVSCRFVSFSFAYFCTTFFKFFFFFFAGCEIGGEEEPEIPEQIAFSIFDRQPQFRY